MSRSYYYLVASLPLLEFGTKPTISYQEFLKNCEGQLTEEDLKIIQKTTLGCDVVIPGANHVFNSWAEFNHNFRNESARFRAVRVSKDPLDYMRLDSYLNPFIAEVVTVASKAPDPLAAENLLDRFKWQHLDELAQGHFFDFEFLIVYALKLQILERHQEIESSKGIEIFEGYKKSGFLETAGV